MLLLKNLDSSSQLVNGATGVVTEFVEASGRRLPKVTVAGSVWSRTGSDLELAEFVNAATGVLLEFSGASNWSHPNVVKFQQSRPNWCLAARTGS